MTTRQLTDTGKLHVSDEYWRDEIPDTDTTVDKLILRNLPGAGLEEFD